MDTDGVQGHRSASCASTAAQGHGIAPSASQGRSLASCASTASLASSASNFTSSSIHTTPSIGALTSCSFSSSSISTLTARDGHGQHPRKSATGTSTAVTDATAHRPGSATVAFRAPAAAKPGAGRHPAPAPTQLELQPSLLVPLQPPVLGFKELQVLVVQLANISASHQKWLLQGWEMHGAAVESAGSAAAGGPSQPQQQLLKYNRTQIQQPQTHQKQKQQLPKVIGFDTEFIGDQLALVQLCCGGRALLIRVPPPQRSTAPSPAPPPTTQKNGGGGSGSHSAASAGAGGNGRGGGKGGKEAGTEHPFSLLPALKTQLCDPNIPKAAAEAWQDAIMLFAAFGIKLRNGLDLTVACPPSDEERSRGRKKLSLFAIFESLFPDAGLTKDKTVDHKLWFSATLSDKQIKYGALDAFVSYAAGVRVMQRAPTQSPPPPVDLTLPAHSELRLAAQWVLTSQFQEASRERKTQHDFYHAKFEMHKKGLVLVVRMSRFKTRLRKFCWVEVKLLSDGRCMSGKCVHQLGKTAHVANLRWVGGGGRGGREVVRGEVSDEVHSIEMEEVRETVEDAITKELLAKVLCGSESIVGGAPLAAGVFGGGSLRLPAAAGPAADKPAVAEARRRVRAAVSELLTSHRVNLSQAEAIEAILCGDRAVQLVQGPPGTGKTTVISRTVELWTRLLAPALPPLGSGRRSEALACVARSNVAAKNIALALLKRGLGPQDFRLVVSEEYHYEWHEEQYRGELQQVLVTSGELRGKDISRRLEGVKVFVTTVSMLASPSFRTTVLYGKELTRLMVDEASQIYAGDLILPLHAYGKHLMSLSLFGDDVQLPPFGSEWDGAQLHSMFDHLTPPNARASARLRLQPNAFTVGPALTPPRGAQAAAAGGASGGAGRGRDVGGVGGALALTAAAAATGDGAHRIMLSVSYRLPPPLCGFISRQLYGGLLQSPAGLLSSTSEGCSTRPAIKWVDVKGEEERGSGSSCRNRDEAAAVVRVVQREFRSSSSWTVITGYDLQRTLLEKELAKHGVGGDGGGGGGDRAGGDRVYNIDTFQGREDEVVIASLVRSGTSLGFMKDDRRVNVMLTRCTRQLVIVGCLELALAHPDTLIGRMAVHCQREGLVETCGGAAASTASASAAAAPAPAAAAATRMSGGAADIRRDVVSAAVAAAPAREAALVAAEAVVAAARARRQWQQRSGNGSGSRRVGGGGESTSASTSASTATAVVITESRRGRGKGRPPPPSAAAAERRDVGGGSKAARAKGPAAVLLDGAGNVTVFG